MPPGQQLRLRVLRQIRVRAIRQQHANHPARRASARTQANYVPVEPTSQATVPATILSSVARTPAHLRRPQWPASHQERPVSAKVQAVRASAGLVSRGIVPETRPTSVVLVPTPRQQRALLQGRRGSARIRVVRVPVERTSVAIVPATTQSTTTQMRRQRQRAGAAVVRCGGIGLVRG